MKFGSKDIPFVYKGDKLIYPNPIKDGLLLWYDFKGMRNTDTNKEVAKDLSGNGNDGTLTNFNFTEGSGYKDNTLVFDGVDDKLIVPELVLDETAMSVMHDGKLYAYEDDKVLTVGEDGEIVGSGINYILNGSERVIEARTEGASARFNYSTFNFSHTLENMKKYILTADVEVTSGNPERVTVLTRTEDREVNLTIGNLPIINGKIQETFISNGLDKMIYFYAGASGATEGNGLIVRNLSISKVYEENLVIYSPSPDDFKTTEITLPNITDLQLYNKTLRKDEILHNAESKGLKKLKPGVVVQDGLILHYDFSHESNTSEYKDKAFDYSGNGNHGVLQNFNFTEESGYAEDGLKFDGVDDYIETEKVPFNKSLTIESIVNLESATSYAPLLRLSPKENLSIGLIYFGVSNNFVENSPHYMLWAGTRGDSGVVQHMSIGTFIPNQMYHLSCVLDVENKTLSIYSDGQLISSLEHDIIPIENNETTLHIAKQSNTDRIFKGRYFSTKIYNRPLTPEEIQHNYQIEKEKFNIVEGDV